MRYAETFKVEPHLADPPVLWLDRWASFQRATAARQSYERTLTTDADKLSSDDVTNMVWLRDEETGEDEEPDATD